MALVWRFLGNLEGSPLGVALIPAGLPVLWLVRKRYGPSIPMNQSQIA